MASWSSINGWAGLTVRVAREAGLAPAIDAPSKSARMHPYWIAACFIGSTARDCRLRARRARYVLSITSQLLQQRIEIFQARVFDDDFAAAVVVFDVDFEA